MSSGNRQNLVRKLQDFDWSIRLILASDVVSGLNKSVMQLKIDLVDGRGNTSEEILEMSHEDLASLLHTLKAAQRIYSTEY